VYFDGLAHVSGDGEILDRWFQLDHLRTLHRHHPALPLDHPPEESGREPADTKYDYYHTNSIELLPPTALGERDLRFAAGNWLLCLHRVNRVYVLSPGGGEVLWVWGGGVLDLPHHPVLLPNGHLLVYDNGTKRGFTRVLEVDPESEEIVWSYEGTPPEDFFSAFRGSNQRLENGNTLICEAERGHAFEVTSEGRIVWEYWNEQDGDQRRSLYRFVRLCETLVAPLLTRSE
jgi:hypothetical protein